MSVINSINECFYNRLLSQIYEAFSGNHFQLLDPHCLAKDH